MAATALRNDERIGLITAVALHVAIAAVFLLHRPAPPPPALPDRVTVTISEEVGPASTSPQPAARAAPDVAPQLGEPQPAPPQPAIVNPPVVPPAPADPAPLARPAPTPPLARPQPKAAPAPPVRAAQPQKAKPAPAPRRPAATKTVATRAKPAVDTRNKPAGGSRIGTDFLKGVPAAEAGDSRDPPAAAIGPAVRASLASAISRQLKPYWAAPQGADAELLVTVLAFNLNPDGSLDGSPRVVRQSGITDANRAQADRHAEQALRAVELAAPFDLPDEYFDAWKHVSSFRFDKRLSQ
ncbi:MAG: hypothetical protein ABIT04_10720 [Novosphingobium sp.]